MLGLLHLLLDSHQANYVCSLRHSHPCNFHQYRSQNSSDHTQLTSIIFIEDQNIQIRKRTNKINTCCEDASAGLCTVSIICLFETREATGTEAIFRITPRYITLSWATSWKNATNSFETSTCLKTATYWEWACKGGEVQLGIEAVLPELLH